MATCSEEVSPTEEGSETGAVWCDVQAPHHAQADARAMILDTDGERVRLVAEGAIMRKYEF